MTETVAPDYRQMWTDLGLNLPMHDALLEHYQRHVWRHVPN